MKPKRHIARKRFGQNFLKDDTVIQNIIRILHPQIHDHLVEIGPGLAAITEPLLEDPNVSQLDVIELDRDLADRLKQQFAHYNKLTIHEADALKFDFNLLLRDENKLRIFGNLPYNISTPLIFHLLEYSSIIKDMHFMFQKEVVDRLIAQPDTKDYGKLTIMTQYFCSSSALFNIEPTSFKPAPKVRSTFVRLIPHQTLPFPAKDFSLLKTITTTAFNQRRKTLSNSLKPFLLAKDFETLNISPTLRAESLTLKNFVEITNYVIKQHNSAGYKL